MAKYYISGYTNESCRVKVFDSSNNDYLGYLDTQAGNFEVVFNMENLNSVDVKAENEDGKVLGYGNVTPLDGAAKTSNINFPYTQVHGGYPASF